MTIKIKYDLTESFKKDFQKLLKKFKTLDDDLENAKKNAIELFLIQKIDNKSVVLIPGFNNEKYKIYKMRKFACKALKGRGAQSGIRIIYAYCEVTLSVTFIEMYFKAEQEVENKTRIEKFIQNKNC